MILNQWQLHGKIDQTLRTMYDGSCCSLCPRQDKDMGDEEEEESDTLNDCDDS
jgi:hypothetical protein